MSDYSGASIEFNIKDLKAFDKAARKRGWRGGIKEMYSDEFDTGSNPKTVYAEEYSAGYYKHIEAFAAAGLIFKSYTEPDGDCGPTMSVALNGELFTVDRLPGEYTPAVSLQKDGQFDPARLSIAYSFLAMQRRVEHYFETGLFPPHEPAAAPQAKTLFRKGGVVHFAAGDEYQIVSFDGHDERQQEVYTVKNTTGQTRKAVVMPTLTLKGYVGKTK